MLSLTCKAAIKATIFLGSRFGDTNLPGIQAISSAIGENTHTVGKLLQKLVHHSVINSIKGPKGGFFVTEEQMNQPAMRIVEAIDGRSAFESCGLGLDSCNEDRPCPLHEDYKHIRNAYEALLNAKRIIDLKDGLGSNLFIS